MIVERCLCHLSPHIEKVFGASNPPSRALFLSLSLTLQEDERIRREREDQEKRRQKQHIDRLAKQVKVRGTLHKR